MSATGSGLYFLDDVDRATWLRLFTDTVDRFRWRCLAVCLLSTHWHALVDVPDDSLPKGMHRLVGRYTKRFNDRHLRPGYLVRGRYWSLRKETAEEVLSAFCYIARNPVGAALVARPEDWPWSSYGATVGVSQRFAFADAAAVLGEFGTTKAAQIRGLRRFVDTA